MDDEALDEHLLELQARLIQALAHPTRLKLLRILGDGEASASALADALGVSRPNLSQHLSVMHQRGLLQVRRVGARRLYRLAYPEIKDACAMFQEVLAAQLTATGRHGPRARRPRAARRRASREGRRRP